LISTPTEARIQLWEARSLGLPFDHIAAMQTPNPRNISCPKCDSIIVAGMYNWLLNNAGAYSCGFHLEDLLQDDGKGYLQQGFVTTCSHCRQRDITKAVLAHRKLAADLAVMPINDAQSHLA
jgi:hypothetical protein